jgi:hypothetical protein
MLANNFGVIAAHILGRGIGRDQVLIQDEKINTSLSHFLVIEALGHIWRGWDSITLAHG